MLPDVPGCAIVSTRAKLYFLSKCRDLLFRVQEHRFTLPQIAEALKSLKLKFIGLEMRDQSALRNFKTAFRQHRALTSLSQWQNIEQQDPDTFTGMYQFFYHQI